jgi:hypothetical protein
VTGDRRGRGPRPPDPPARGVRGRVRRQARAHGIVQCSIVQCSIVQCNK